MGGAKGQQLIGGALMAGGLVVFVMTKSSLGKTVGLAMAALGGLLVYGSFYEGT